LLYRLRPQSIVALERLLKQYNILAIAVRHLDRISGWLPVVSVRAVPGLCHHRLPPTPLLRASMSKQRSYVGPF
jgi:hypothetical protein